MFSMFKSVRALLMVAAMTLSAMAGAVNLQDPYQMMNEVADRTFSEIQSNRERMNDRGYRISLIRTELMPYVDSRYIAYKIIGAQLKSTSEQERADFASAFETYIIHAFADALGKYDQQVLVSPAYQKVPDTESMTSIRYLVRENGKPDLELLFKLRRNTKTGEWRVFDLVAENISMLQAKQSELSPMIREQGLAAVTRLLQERQQ